VWLSCRDSDVVRHSHGVSRVSVYFSRMSISGVVSLQCASSGSIAVSDARPYLLYTLCIKILRGVGVLAVLLKARIPLDSPNKFVERQTLVWPGQQT